MRINEGKVHRIMNVKSAGDRKARPHRPDRIEIRSGRYIKFFDGRSNGGASADSEIAAPRPRAKGVVHGLRTKR